MFHVLLGLLVLCLDGVHHWSRGCDWFGCAWRCAHRGMHTQCCNRLAGSWGRQHCRLAAEQLRPSTMQTVPCLHASSAWHPMITPLAGTHRPCCTIMWGMPNAQAEHVSPLPAGDHSALWQSSASGCVASLTRGSLSVSVGSASCGAPNAPQGPAARTVVAALGDFMALRQGAPRCLFTCMPCAVGAHE